MSLRSFQENLFPRKVYWFIDYPRVGTVFYDTYQKRFSEKNYLAKKNADHKPAGKLEKG